MGSIVLYILEWAFALLLLLTVYKICFSGTTLHRFNRFYLLGATALSALLPLVHLTLPQAKSISIQSTSFAMMLQEITITADAPAPAPVAPETASDYNWAWLLVGAWTVYVLVLVIGWTRSIIKMKRFIKGKPTHRMGRIRVVSHDEQYGPFSWMNCIVISDSEIGFARRASLRHELSHIRLGHYADLIFLLACTIVNPVCWLIMKEIKIVHEYEADDEVINHYGIVEKDYQRLLIMRTVGAEAYALASSFNLNIKQRITMMKKEKTLKRRMLYLFAVIPVIAVVFMACGNRAKTNEIPEQAIYGPDELVKAGEVLTGHVFDESGKPLAGANVTETDEQGRILAHSVTDVNGLYALRLAGEGHKLEVSYVGFDSGTVNPIVKADNDFNLIESAHVAKITIEPDGKMSIKATNVWNAPSMPLNSMKELSDLVKANDTKKCIVSMAPEAPKDGLADIKKALRKNNVLNIVYETQKISNAVSASDLPGTLPGVEYDEVPVEQVTANSRQSDEEDTPFMVVEEMPEFPGGTEALLEYLRTNLKYPQECREKNVQGRVLVQFIVNKDGTISDPVVVKQVNPLLDAEALRVIKTMPVWKPGVQRGEKVKVKFTLPVNFRLE